MAVARPEKVVLVTGASAGIGAAIARELVHQGYRKLVLTARRGDRLERLAGALTALGAEVLTIPADLADPAAAERIVAETRARFGALDVLINNAGFGLPTFFADGDPVALRRQLEVDFVAPLLLAREALPSLIERRGTVINIGSAITAVANSNLGAYGATKAGLAYWNDALRRELRQHGVQVCLVEPGPVKTEFFDAVTALAPPGAPSNAVHGAMASWMSARVEDVAARVVRLIERPKRRLSVLRRVVWPFRLIGGLFQVWPALGDLALASLTRHLDEKVSRANSPRRLDDVPTPR